jgi:hypothetical protein
MSFRVELSTITGNAPSAGGKRPIGHGSPAEVADDLSSYRETAGLDAFQINFHGNGNATLTSSSNRWSASCKTSRQSCPASELAQRPDLGPAPSSFPGG